MVEEARVRTQVGIVGAGPAGLLLSHLLHLAGVESVVVEARSREYAENRIRAGILEHQVVEVLDQAGVGERMRQSGLPHDGTQLLFGGQLHRIDFQALTGKRVMVYGQHEVVRDLIAARMAAPRGDNDPILFECGDVTVDGFESAEPVIRFIHDGQPQSLRCEIIAGCDGFHGICRPSLPQGRLREYDRTYPFGWLGILADAPP
ncbi:MAG: FAD-dependent monooxygenase, partial [Acetobacteraceae bacterium]|nr:FAD-dependent monooxygenase [Acetobacteraceae bacterium]